MNITRRSMLAGSASLLALPILPGTADTVTTFSFGFYGEVPMEISLIEPASFPGLVSPVARRGGKPCRDIAHTDGWHTFSDGEMEARVRWRDEGDMWHLDVDWYRLVMPVMYGKKGGS